MNKNFTRRAFLGTTLAAGAGLALGQRLQMPWDKKSLPGPVILSTWKQGITATKKAWDILETGGTGLEAVEKGINTAEDDTKVNSVGLGGLPDEDGIVTLDACLIDGPNKRFGSVAGLEDIRNPISVARKVMEETDHLMLVGEGAKKFALKMGFKEENLLTEESEQRWRKWKEDPKRKGFWGKPEDSHDTIGLILMDKEQNLFGGVSTSGLAWKIHGRVGDSPIIGAGLFVDNEVGAACATGRGEEVIKTCGSFLIVELMRKGVDPQSACEEALDRIKKNNPKRKDFMVGYLAFNTEGDIGAAALYQDLEYAVYIKEANLFLKAKLIK